MKGGQAMITCHIVVDGKSRPMPLNLPSVPIKGDIIAQSPDHKSEHYLVKCVEYVNGHNSVNLHVQIFPNRDSAILAIDNIR